jgi:ornithine carbamoyltransferase
MVFEKPSLRTRVSFDVGMYQLGGYALYLSPQEIGLGKRETVEDVARVLSSMCDGLMARVFKHETVVRLAEYSQVPVINGLCDIEHPCQALADLLTLHECKGLEGRTLAYLGDGNNVCHSLMLLCTKLGVRFRCATPEGYAPQQQFVEQAQSEGAVEVLRDATEAVRGADAVYTDVWTSMGQEEENAARLQVFPPYQVNAQLMSHAKPDAIVLHDLPARRGEEISNEVMEGPQQAIWQQAENRLHAQKAVLVWLLNQKREERFSADTSGVSVQTSTRLSSAPLPQT